MSTNPSPARRLPPQVYRRRRLIVLLGLIAVVIAIVLVIVRPGSGQGDGADAAGTAGSTESPSADGAAGTAETLIPTEPTAVDGDTCTDEQIQVEAVTDKTVYETGEQPQLSVTITNTGGNVCVLNAGTNAQIFTITSGEEQYWISTDCQVDPIDAEVSLTPNTPISSSVPIVWDRTRSSVDSCEGPREAVPADGASYHLAVSVDGFASATTKQFQLY
jgi:hypothetical protein